MRLKSGFAGCKWCGGNGCLGCDEERKESEKRSMEPIFTADRNDPEDMRQLKEIFGADALQESFGEGGGGLREIEEKAAVASLLQAIRKSSAKPQ